MEPWTDWFSTSGHLVGACAGTGIGQRHRKQSIQTVDYRYRTYVILGKACKGFWWRGHQVTNNDLLVFPPSNELRSASGEDFEVYTVSVRINYLEQLSENPGLRGFADRKQEIVPLDSRTVQDLRATAAMIVKSTGGPVALAASQALAENWQFAQPMLTPATVPPCANVIWPLIALLKTFAAHLHRIPG